MSFMGQKEQGYSNVEFEDLMRCIPEKYRTILVLYYAEGYNSREIAMMLGMRSATVRTRLVRGRTLLKIYLALSFFLSKQIITLIDHNAYQPSFKKMRFL